jgi:hypothetical protein
MAFSIAFRPYTGSQAINWTSYIAPTGIFIVADIHLLWMKIWANIIWHITNRSSNRWDKPKKNEINPINKAKIEIPLKRLDRFLIFALYLGPYPRSVSVTEYMSSYLEN